MKSHLALIAVAALTASSVSASAETVFYGTLKFTAVSNCQNQYAGSFYNSVFYPNVAGNAPLSSISEVYNYGIFGYTLNHGSFTSVFKTVVGVNYGSYLGTYAPQVRVTSISPALTANPQALTIKGQIRGANQDHSGLACLVAFTGTYQRGNL